MSMFDCPACGAVNGLGQDGCCWPCGHDVGHELPALDPADCLVTPVPDDHPQLDRIPRGIGLCAGPGGWDEAARILGGRQLVDDLDVLGLDISRDAAATARAAGYARVDHDAGDIRRWHPVAFPDTKLLITSTPCPPWSSSAGRNAVTEHDEQVVCDAITALGYGDDLEWTDLAERIANPVAALAVETFRWALQLPDVETVVAEQVPRLERMYEEGIAELAAAGWESFDTVTFDAAPVVGLPVRRRRTYLVARRYAPGRVGLPLPGEEVLPGSTWSGALGWEPGERVRTRGNRRATGGNLFDADKVGWCLTEKARTWERDRDGARLTAAEAGWLQGFTLDYPWQGSRTSRFLQAADVVAPPAGAAVLGSALGIPWREPLARWWQARQNVLVPGRVERAQLAGALF